MHIHAEFHEVEPDEQVFADAQGFDILADGAILVAHILPDVLGCAHGRAHDAEALYLYYIEVGRKHGEKAHECLTRSIRCIRG